jgi:hypothetical protein
MNLKQALERITELEIRIAALERAPKEIHYHAAPLWAPEPKPYSPYWMPPIGPTCESQVDTAAFWRKYDSPL